MGVVGGKAKRKYCSGPRVDFFQGQPKRRTKRKEREEKKRQENKVGVWVDCREILGGLNYRKTA